MVICLNALETFTIITTKKVEINVVDKQRTIRQLMIGKIVLIR